MFVSDAQPRNGEETVVVSAAWLADMRQAIEIVVNDRCPTDERHCACVPFLRGEVDYWRTQVDVLDSIIAAAKSEDISDELRERLLAAIIAAFEQDPANSR